MNSSCYLACDPVNNEPALDVIDEPEVLASLLNLDDIHESSGELGIGPDLAVNLDQPLLEDGLNLLAGQGIAKPVPQEDGNGHGLSQPKKTQLDTKYQ